MLNKAQFWQRWRHAHERALTLVLNCVLDGMEGRLTNAKWAAIGKCLRNELRDISDWVGAW